MKFLDFLKNLFVSPKAKQLQKQISEAITFAQPIVQAIAALTPNRTLDEIAKAYQTYGVPLASALNQDDPKVKGLALRDLAVSVLGKKYPAETQTLNTAVELALALVRASA